MTEYSKGFREGVRAECFARNLSDAEANVRTMRFWLLLSIGATVACLILQSWIVAGVWGFLTIFYAYQTWRAGGTRDWQARVECDAEGHVFDGATCLRCGIVSYRATAAMGAPGEPVNVEPLTARDIYRMFDVESVYGIDIKRPHYFRFTGGDIS